MKLEPFYQAIGPFLLGETDHETAVRVIYGGEQAAGGVDAERLRIYGAFCRIHRHEALSLFSYCEAAVVHHLGQPAWDDLVDRYFRAHPMHHWELNANGVHLSEFLAQNPMAALPFLAELADFEWWEWQTQVAPDAGTQAAEQGPLRLGDTVELRHYHYDFVGWLDTHATADMATAGLPEPGEHLILFWRDREEDLRREPASQEELMVLRLVSEGAKIPQGLRETAADLHAAGIILGEF